MKTQRLRTTRFIEMCFFVGALCLCGAAKGLAAPVVYHDRAAFVADAGVLLTQTFDSYSHEQSLKGQTILPGVEVVSNNSNLVVWNPSYKPGNQKLFAYGGGARSAGDSYYEIRTNPGTDYRAVGFEIVDWEIGGEGRGTGRGRILVNFRDNTILDREIHQYTNAQPVFWGVIAESAIASVRWCEDHEHINPYPAVGLGNEESALDNVMVGTPAPEPATVLLAGLGLAGLAGIGRGRRER